MISEEQLCCLQNAYGFLSPRSQMKMRYVSFRYVDTVCVLVRFAVVKSLISSQMGNDLLALGSSPTPLIPNKINDLSNAANVIAAKCHAQHETMAEISM